jgi:pimeloyl-ACP methyl ester carboxylesterase
MANPTGDVIDLINHLSIKEEIVLIGHSMGGYTALNVINFRDDIKKAVIISGFLSISLMIHNAVKQRFIASRICKYERKTNQTFYDLDNEKYLRETKDDIFFIQSEDDQMVPYEIGLKIVESINNPHIKTLKLTNRKHNPSYTDAAIAYMNEVFGEYYNLLREKKIKTDEEKIAYFADVSLPKLVEQDENIINQIVDFIG